MPLRFSAASSSDNKRALVATAGAAACADRWRVGGGESTPGTALCAVYPPQGPRARDAKKRDKSAVRPTVKTRDLWRQLAAASVRSFEDALLEAEIGRAHAELQSLMRISYAVFCLKNKKQR